MALFVTEIERIARELAFAHRGQAEDVRLGEVEHVDVVANTRAIGRGIIVSEDRDVLALPEGQATREAELAARGIREMRFILLGALHWNPAFGQVPLELLRPKP